MSTKTKSKTKTDPENLADISIKISTVLNRHLAEERCPHGIHEIIREVFSDG